MHPAVSAQLQLIVKIVAVQSRLQVPHPDPVRPMEFRAPPKALTVTFRIPNLLRSRRSPSTAVSVPTGVSVPTSVSVCISLLLVI